MVSVEELHKENKSTLWLYDDEDKLTEVTIQKVSRNWKLSKAQREIKVPTQSELLKPQTYHVHPGYRHVLLGFIQEIEFMTSDKLKSHNCLFHATYLMKILDEFAKELESYGRPQPGCFQSHTLNPILQCQLRGVSDHEPATVRAEVGGTL